MTPEQSERYGQVGVAIAAQRISRTWFIPRREECCHRYEV